MVLEAFLHGFKDKVWGYSFSGSALALIYLFDAQKLNTWKKNTLVIKQILGNLAEAVVRPRTCRKMFRFGRAQFRL